MECFIVSKSTNKYLDVEHSAMKCGAKVVVSNFHGGPSQKWRIQANKIFSVNSNHALDIKWGESSGRSILQWNSHGGSNQKWNICNDQTIRSPKGLCLQVQGSMFILPNTMEVMIKNGKLLNVPNLLRLP